MNFGAEPAKMDDELVEAIKNREKSRQINPEPLFKPGKWVLVNEALFGNIEAIYQIKDGERRVMVLIEMLSRQVCLGVSLSDLNKFS